MGSNGSVGSGTNQSSNPCRAKQQPEEANTGKVIISSSSPMGWTKVTENA
jgi:hypothetical protein